MPLSAAVLELLPEAREGRQNTDIRGRARPYGLFRMVDLAQDVAPVGKPMPTCRRSRCTT